MLHSHRSASLASRRRRNRVRQRPPSATGSAPSGSSTRTSSPSSDWSTPTGVPGGWDGSTSTSASCSTGSGCPDGPRRPGRSPASRRRTSIWPSWWRSRCRPVRSSGHCAESGGDLLESVELFDVYRGPSVDEGSRSLAFRLRFSALDRTLTDEEMGRYRAGLHRRGGDRAPGRAALSRAYPASGASRDSRAAKDRGPSQGTRCRRSSGENESKKASATSSSPAPGRLRPRLRGGPR